MGIKKVARPINNAKNEFVKWLKDKNASDIDVYEGEDSDAWDYYRSVTGFIGESLYIAYFTMWSGKVKISYQDEYNSHDDMSIEEFLLLID